ncbi:MAG: tRNA (cytidine(34)-2'-O)-methyltransferase [Verrucomicrobiota bacterium]|nr:tRNA (cytidine(34)-2'-O)-methyltransferase [Verrucomicrobiota bacterium]
MKIVLFQPQIPQNTGNIARTCAATHTGLVLVRPLGFSLSSRHMKRAGLDYWDQVALEVIDDLPTFIEESRASIFFFSSKAKQLYTEASYPSNALLIFGSETSGLPETLWETYPGHFYRIPMVPEQRCLNLASSAAIALYEALRQTNFATF